MVLHYKKNSPQGNFLCLGDKSQVYTSSCIFLILLLLITNIATHNTSRCAGD